MPSKSKAQHNLMSAVAHSPSFARKVGIPQSVGKDFNSADKGRKFSRGGDMATKLTAKHHMAMAHHHLKMAMGGDTVGTETKDQSKGMTTSKMGKVPAGSKRAYGEHGIQERGHTRAMEPKMKGNIIGDGPLYNVKGPAMKRGGKTHHKK